MLLPHTRVFALLTLLACILPAPAAEKIDLDVTRIALFSSGVGYFESTRQVAGDATTVLQFRTEQINDIIKSMIVQDFDGGQVGVIGYASRDPIAKTLESFAVDLTDKPTLAELLEQLRGEPVIVSGVRDVRGTIVKVEQTQVHDADQDTLETVDWLTLLTADGLQRVRLDALNTIELANEKIAAELRQALETLAGAHDADRKRVTINFEGSGQRRIRVAYLLEAPIWKTTYRLVLSDDAQPFLQGWATVDNATEDDWNNVQLSLVSGRPISFRMDLYTPLYVPRPMEQLDLYTSLRPPDYEGGFPADTQAFARGRPMSEPASPARRGGRGVQRGEMAESAAFGVAGKLMLDDSGVASVATAEEAGELFAYHIDTPVSIPRHHSAMLPIVNRTIEADKLSIFNPQTHPKHPLHGLELKNTTGLYLMQGPITVFDGDTYAGDAKLPDLSAGARRLIAYALDLSTEVLIEQQPTPEQIIGLRIVKGTLWHQHKHVDKREYLVKNQADKPRTVLLEQQRDQGWELVQPKEPYEKTAHAFRFKVPVPANDTVKQVVELERVTRQSIALTNLDVDSIRMYLRARVVSPALQDALERVIELRSAVDQARRTREQLEQQREEAIAKQARIRENLQVLDKSTDAYRRQLEQFDEVDRRIADLEQRIRDARETERQKRDALDTYLVSLNVD